MNIRKMRKAMKAVAKANGITETQAVAEIEKVIVFAIKKAQLENDQQTLAKWNDIPSEGDVPTAYELVGYLRGKMKKQLAEN